MNIKKYQLILENENKIYKINGKDAVFNTYKEAVENYKKIKTSEPIIIREISKNKIRDLNQTASYNKQTGEIVNYEDSILFEKNIDENTTDEINEDITDEINEDITDEIINNEWNNYENEIKNQENINEPIRGFIIKNEIFKNKIFKILNYIQSELFNLEKENLGLNNKIFFNCRKEILIKLSDKLIIEIKKIKKIKEKINLIKYNK